MLRGTKLALAALGLTALSHGSAHAHIKLLMPQGWVVTAANGDPQKDPPCGPRANATVMRTNAVTKVRPGQKLKVVWTETVGHPGHFRISIAADRALFKDPPYTLMAGQCNTAEIQAPPVLPVVADGLLQSGRMGTMREYEITVPDMTCDRCTLQVLQFMSRHAPSCFYYQCADIQITNDIDGGAAPSTDAGRGGADSAASQTDAGMPASGADASGAGGSGAGGSGSGGRGGAAGTGSGGTSGTGGTTGTGVGTTGAGGGTPVSSGGTSGTSTTGGAPATGAGATGGGAGGAGVTTKRSGSGGGCAVARRLVGGSPDAGRRDAGLLVLASFVFGPALLAARRRRFTRRPALIR